VLAYAYSCNEGDYPFTVTASATFNGEVEATSAGSVLSVVSAEAGAMFNTGLATIVLACSVVIIVLVVWRAKLGMGFRFGFGLGRGRGRRVPEFFRKLGIDVVG
jgi:hypothetical protein